MNLEENDLCGWELNNPDNNLFDIEITQVLGDCGDCEFLGECTTPCASLRRLIPKEGSIVKLGREKQESGSTMSYFAVVGQSDVRFILLNEPVHYWARASYITYEQVPVWALSQLDPVKKSCRDVCFLSE